jgi:hypothetical protein
MGGQAKMANSAEICIKKSILVADDSVSLVMCPVGYSENVALTNMFGEIIGSF